MQLLQRAIFIKQQVCVLDVCVHGSASEQDVSVCVRECVSLRARAAMSSPSTFLETGQKRELITFRVMNELQK